ncbi:MAG: ASPIC/UnbV domain-containing protein, partial [Deinococcales bacterium]|nr:ASPIC/UnbV domain-containing protein [Deinococcales bacterium]
GNFGVNYTLYRNTGEGSTNNNWITIRLEGRPPINRDALGARVFVTTPDGTTRMQEVKSGSSLGAGNDTALHFGLGQSTTSTIRVKWPDGTEETFEGITKNQTWHVIYERGVPFSLGF